MGGARFMGRQGRYPKKKRHKQKPPIRAKWQELNNYGMRGEVNVNDVSVHLPKAKHALDQLSLSSALEKASMDASSTTTSEREPTDTSSTSITPSMYFMMVG